MESNLLRRQRFAPEKESTRPIQSSVVRLCLFFYHRQMFSSEKISQGRTNVRIDSSITILGLFVERHFFDKNKRIDFVLFRSSSSFELCQQTFLLIFRQINEFVPNLIEQCHDVQEVIEPEDFNFQALIGPLNKIRALA